MVVDTFLVILSLSISGTMIALLLLFLKPIYRKKFSQTWQYYIWSIVILRMLIPFSPEINFYHFLAKQEQVISFPDNITLTRDREENFKPFMNAKEKEVTPVIPLEQKSIVDVKPVAEIYSKYSFWDYIAFAWLVIVLFLLSRKVLLYNRFVYKLKKESIVCESEELHRQLRQTCSSMHVKHIPQLYINPMVPSPMLVGTICQFIVLPDITVSKDLVYILQHELIHYKRKDIIYKWFVQLTSCIHWFNPLVYWMNKEINRNCELACDEKIIRNMENEERCSYGQAILSVIKSQNTAKYSGIALSMSGDARLIKERLEVIMKHKKSKKMTVVISLSIAFLFLTGAAFAGSYAKKPVDLAVKEGSARNSGLNKELMIKEQSEAPLLVNYSAVEFDDGPYAWPGHVFELENKSDKVITNYEIVSLAYDKFGNPVSLFWDADNVAADGSVGNVGFGSGGIEYGIVTDISPNSPKSYFHIYDCYYPRYMIDEGLKEILILEKKLELELLLEWEKIEKEMEAELSKIKELDSEEYKQERYDWIEEYQIERKEWLEEYRESRKEWIQEREEHYLNPILDSALEPGEKEKSYYSLFDGWNQEEGVHLVETIITCVKEVTFEDGSKWVNEEYEEWMETYYEKKLLKKED